ncbi:MAG TPA: hypothetical protein VLM75_16275 [Spirochaetota bacterium]|nr:hypothetical protein [Spirochaetota bacterium]
MHMQKYRGLLTLKKLVAQVKGEYSIDNKFRTGRAPNPGCKDFRQHAWEAIVALDVKQ